jgi:hypothetical protein
VTWTRRRFVVSSVTICAGAAIAGDPAARLLSRAAKVRVRLLKSRDEEPSTAFERGVHAALEGAAAGIDALEMPVRADLAQWRALAAALPGCVVLGVVTPSEFVLVNELIRETGARLLYQGEHAIDRAGSAWHALTTSSMSAGGGAPFAQSQRRWPHALGFALARAFVSPCAPGVATSDAMGGHADAHVCSSFVSFVFTA